MRHSGTNVCRWRSERGRFWRRPRDVVEWLRNTSGGVGSYVCQWMQGRPETTRTIVVLLLYYGGGLCAAAADKPDTKLTLADRPTTRMMEGEPESPSLGPRITLDRGVRTVQEIARAITSQSEPYGLSMKVDVVPLSGRQEKKMTIITEDDGPPLYLDEVSIDIGFRELPFWQAAALVAVEAQAGITVSSKGRGNKVANLFRRRRLLPGYWADGPWLVGVVQEGVEAGMPQQRPRGQVDAGNTGDLIIQVFADERIAEMRGDIEIQPADSDTPAQWRKPTYEKMRFGSDLLFKFQKSTKSDASLDGNVRFRFPAETVRTMKTCQVPIKEGAVVKMQPDGLTVKVKSIQDGKSGKKEIEYAVSWDTGLSPVDQAKYEQITRIDQNQNVDEGMSIWAGLAAKGLVRYRIVNADVCKEDGTPIPTSLAEMEERVGITGIYASELHEEKAVLRLVLGKKEFSWVTGTISPWRHAASRPAENGGRQAIPRTGQP